MHDGIAAVEKPRSAPSRPPDIEKNVPSGNQVRRLLDVMAFMFDSKSPRQREQGHRFDAARGENQSSTVDFEAEIYAPLEPARFADQPLAQTADVGRRNKRRKGSKNPSQKKDTKKGPPESGENFDIHAHDNEKDSEDDAEENAAANFPSQLKDFKGKDRQIIDQTRAFFHLFLLNHNAFPSDEEIEDWGQEAYKHACIAAYKHKHEGD